MIAAGIREVIYIEPYPKSRALKFHDDAATTDKADGVDMKLRFKPFVGVGPRHFFDLFSMTMSGGRPVERKNGASGEAVKWSPQDVSPRIQMLPFAHRRFEEAARQYIKRTLKVTAS